MRNHILGFSDEHGKSPSVLLFGTEHGVENNKKEWVRMKNGDWPDGIIRAEIHCDDRGCEQIAINHTHKVKKETSMKYKHVARAIALFFGLIFGASAFAQSEPVYYSQTIWSWPGIVGPTNLVGTFLSSAGTLNGSGVIDARKQDKVGIQISFNYNTNTVQTNGIVWIKSVDGVRFDTNDVILTYLHRTAAPTAGAADCLITNISMNGAGYLKAFYWTNSGYGAADTVYPTNVLVKWAAKINAP